MQSLPRFSKLRRWPRPVPSRPPIAARCRSADRAGARHAPSPRYMQSVPGFSNPRRWPRPALSRPPIAAWCRPVGRAGARHAPSPRYMQSLRGFSNPQRWPRPGASQLPTAARQPHAGRAGARHAPSPRYTAFCRTCRARRPHRTFCPRRASRPRGGTTARRGVGSSCRVVLQGLRRAARIAADEPTDVGTAPPRGKHAPARHDVSPRRRCARDPGQPSASSRATRSGRSIEAHACRAAATCAARSAPVAMPARR
jgi:hypothetical protein